MKRCSRWDWIAVCAACAFVSGCGPGVFSTPAPPTELHVAAAANLSGIFDELATAEWNKNHIRLIPSFGSTAQLTQQIEAGAPFDLFLAADSEHPVALASAGLADQPQEYARGRIVIWAPKRPDIRSLDDFRRADVRVIAIANPALAPYGRASTESLRSRGLWDSVESKVVYGQNIAAALAFANTGNADVALTAYALVAAKHPEAPLVPAELHQPIIQSLCFLRRTSSPASTRTVIAFLLGPEARALLQKSGYEVPKP